MSLTIFISNAARDFAPEIAHRLEAAGWHPVAKTGQAQSALLASTELPLAVTHVRLAPALGCPPALAHGPTATTIAFDSPDDRFAAALAGELLRPADRPAVADPSSHALLALAQRVAVTAISVLIGGPTGTGKEVLARFVHAASPRASGPMLAVNCAALPEAMLEAILFGHERGAFTGAATASLGLFRAADGGTLLLDEIAELPLALQAKLLRVLQEREVLPIGATTARPVDVRVIATANRDLAAEVAAGRFRADLYYRLSVFPLATRPLAERPADVDALAATLLVRHGGTDAAWWPRPGVLERLAQHRWPGNVRELENVLQRALVLAGTGRIGVEHLMFDTPAAAQTTFLPPVRLPDIRRAREHDAIRAALAETGGRRVVTAERLGISERTLRYKLAEMARATA